MRRLDRFITIRRWLTRERMRLVAFAVLFASLIGLLAIVARSDGFSTPAATRSGPTSPTSMPPAPMCSKAAPRRRSIRGPACPATGDFRRQHAVLRLALSAVLPVHCGRARAAALRGCAGGVGHDHLPALSVLGPRDPAPARTAAERIGGRERHRPAVVAVCGGFLRRCWSMPVTAITASSPRRCLAARWSARSPAGGRRLLFGAAELQAAIRSDDPAGADRHPALARLRRRGGSPSRRSSPQHCRVRTAVWSAFLASTEFSRVVVLEAGSTGWHSSRACSHGCACGAVLSPRLASMRHGHRAGVVAGPALAERSAVSAQGRRPDIASVLATPYASTTT